MKSISSLAFALCVVLGTLSVQAASISSEETTLNVLTELFQTNADFLSTSSSGSFDVIKEGQAPRYILVRCADSRIYNTDLTPVNDAFVVSNAGNQTEPVKGSIGYAVWALKTPVLIYLGHSRCGAVDAVLKGKPTGHDEIDGELSTLGLTADNLNDAILENVHNQVATSGKIYADKVSSGELTRVGVLYDFAGDWGMPGTLYLVNVNGVTDSITLQEQYGTIPGINFLS